MIYNPEAELLRLVTLVCLATVLITFVVCIVLMVSLPYLLKRQDRREAERERREKVK